MPGRGGARKGAGRKTKDEEEKAQRLSVKALVNVFGSEEKAMEHAATMSQSDDKNSFQYFKLLIEYAYGKPKETKDVNIEMQPIFNINE